MCSGIQDHDDPRFGCDCHLGADGPPLVTCVTCGAERYADEMVYDGFDRWVCDIICAIKAPQMS